MPLIVGPRPEPVAVAPCDLCKGRGGTYVPERDAYKKCPCRTRADLVAVLGEDLMAGEPLVGGSPLTDCLTDSLLIRARWADLRAHLRKALGTAYVRAWADRTGWSARTLTDEDIRTAYVDSSDYHDVVDAPSLLVVRIGFVAYKNLAVPGAILTTLRRREGKRPTWVHLDTEDRPFSEGHFSWSADLAKYLERNYVSVTWAST